MTPKDYQQFGLYAKDKGISSLDLHYHNQKIEDSLTPYILEERQMNVTIMDVFSRLMMERIIWVAGGVDDHMSTICQAQLMFLDSLDHNDITMHIDSPGGSVKSGLSIVDVMDYITSDIRTINTGMAASMGSVLLGAGTKGKRGSLRFSQTMLHQSSGGAQVMEMLSIGAGRQVGEALTFLMEIRLEEGLLGDAEVRRRLEQWWATKTD